MDWNSIPTVSFFETLPGGLFPNLRFVSGFLVRHTVGLLLILKTLRPVMMRKIASADHFLVSDLMYLVLRDQVQ